ncbi:MAG: helix-turn-helix domain-containing protein [Deltaproteobacteria bacterium]|jgi:transcriptional regulator with XRE-family HTH domain|nr:helix-turn-helix domain-containing protein [Deltaproteobacteria bacterium]MCL5880946.1 helix-turn-helix domain-containing protein [Deltaproteobacteria bacterium]MDA8303585.1 helix-turn-helix domain-containing protein [Deltaproteobacteria bacterium]
MTNIFELIKTVRKEKGISQAELAKRLNTTQSYIAQIELGHKNLREKSIQKIFKALGIEEGNYLNRNPVFKLSNKLIANKEDLQNLKNSISFDNFIFNEFREISDNIYVYKIPGDELSGIGLERNSMAFIKYTDDVKITYNYIPDKVIAVIKEENTLILGRIEPVNFFGDDNAPEWPGIDDGKHLDMYDPKEMSIKGIVIGVISLKIYQKGIDIFLPGSLD